MLNQSHKYRTRQDLILSYQMGILAHLGHLSYFPYSMQYFPWQISIPAIQRLTEHAIIPSILEQH